MPLFFNILVIQIAMLHLTETKPNMQEVQQRAFVEGPPQWNMFHLLGIEMAGWKATTHLGLKHGIASGTHSNFNGSLHSIALPKHIILISSWISYEVNIQTVISRILISENMWIL